MNNRNEKKYLKLEYPKKKYFMLQYTRMNDNKKINILIISIFFKYFQNSKIIYKKILILIILLLKII
jgi:hypothetical protein